MAGRCFALSRELTQVTACFQRSSSPGLPFPNSRSARLLAYIPLSITVSPGVCADLGAAALMPFCSM